VRVLPGLQGARRVRQHLVEDDARVQRLALVLVPVLVVAIRERLRLQALESHLQLLELAVDQPVRQRGDDDEVDEGERAGNDEQKGEAEPGANASERVHRSRKRYPTPRTVRMISGSDASRSSFSRRCRMCTSIVRGSR